MSAKIPSLHNLIDGLNSLIDDIDPGTGTNSCSGFLLNQSFVVLADKDAEKIAAPESF
jgi:hypothetical protein